MTDALKQARDALKPCPFCGGTANLTQEGSRRQSCIVECDDCGAMHESSDEGENSGRSWNRRADAAQAAPVAQSDEFYWLVELFLPGGGNSLGKYHTGFATLHGTSRSTEDVYKAKRYATKAEAEAAANRLESLRGVWHAVEHGFAAPPAPAARPCIGGNPTCPCQDGYLCHYVDSPDGKTKAMPIPPAPAAQEPPRCPYCDDTGDVNSITGEWRGVCSCPAGDRFRTAQQEPAQAVPFTGAQTAATTLVRVLVEPAQADARGPLTQAAADVLAERRRQVDVEGWTPDHDDEHDAGELAAAGSAYALAAADSLHPQSQGDGDYESEPPVAWPWDAAWWKHGDPRRSLVKASALLLAEIERLDRAAQAKPAGGAHG